MFDRRRGVQSYLSAARKYLRASNRAGSMLSRDPKLAEILGVSYQRVGEWERGERNPRLSTQGKLADALGVTPVELRAALAACSDGQRIVAA
jgi:transcriptional regulator with XRE-family HTH domain